MGQTTAAIRLVHDTTVTIDPDRPIQVLSACLDGMEDLTVDMCSGEMFVLRQIIDGEVNTVILGEAMVAEVAKLMRSWMEIG